MNHDKSRAELLGFLDYSKSKGLLKPASAEARKAAVNQVLGILSDDEAQDVSKIDIDQVLDRFQNLHGKRYTPDSLRTYRARVRNSIADFLRYQQNPMDYQPRTTVSIKRMTSTKPPARQLLIEAKRDDPVSPLRVVSSAHMSTATLPIPLRPDLTVLIHGLPFDLTVSEATKIANVVMAMSS